MCGNNPQENEIILELCKFLDTDIDKIAYAFSSGLHLQYILGQLLFNRMGGVAYYTLKKSGLLSKMNREFINPLQQIYESGIERTESFFKAEELLAELFQGIQCNFALLKGAFLSQLYPVGLRTSNDFDLLISKTDVQEVSKLLLHNGFQQGFLKNGEFTPATRNEIVYALMNKGETVPFVKEVRLPRFKHLEIDINFSLDFQAAQSTENINSMLSSTENAIVTKNGTLPTLSTVMFLVHLCAHLYKEATTYFWVQANRDLSLYKFCDIYLFVAKYMDQSFSEQLIDVIHELGMSKECHYSFVHTRTLFEIDNQNFDTVIHAIQPEDCRFMTQIFDPTGKRVFCYDMNFKDFMFHPKRYSILSEVKQIWKS